MMDKVLEPLKGISPLLQHIKLDKKKAEAFPDLLKVLECHTQSTDCMIQFFKEPLVDNCKCNCNCNCTEGIIQPVRMPQAVYQKVMRFPMPMPNPKPAEAGDGSTDLHYLSFTDAQRFAMANEHQPSLAAAALRTAAAAAAKKKQVIARSGLASARVTSSLAANVKLLKNKSGFQIGITNRVRGVVSCNTCLKPRCIYSQSAISQMKPPLPPANPDNTAPDSAPPTATKEQYQKMAQDRLHYAMESPIFMCGMSPLSPEDPCYDVFQCDP